jgi:hypothetical protein
MASREPHCQLSGSKVCFSSKRSMHGSNILTQYKSYRPGRREGKKPCLIRNCSRFSRQICIFCSYRLIRCTMRSWCTNRTRGIHRKINGRHRYCKEVLPRCTPLHVEFYENHPQPLLLPKWHEQTTNRAQPLACAAMDATTRATPFALAAAALLCHFFFIHLCLLFITSSDGSSCTPSVRKNASVSSDMSDLPSQCVAGSGGIHRGRGSIRGLFVLPGRRKG